MRTHGDAYRYSPTHTTTPCSHDTDSDLALLSASCTARHPTCTLGTLDFIALYHDTTGSNRPTLRLGWAKHVPKMRPEHANTYDSTHR